MSKDKSSASAVHQRKQERARREQSMQRGQNAHTQPRGRRSRRKSSLNSWLFVGGIIVVVVGVIGAFIWYGNREQTTPVAVSPGIYKSLTTVNPSLLSQVGTGGLDKSGSSLSTVLKTVKSAPMLKGPTGKPEVFYMGGEYCPFCAAQRWSVIVALSRFGSFPTPPTPLVSGEDNISTFSFYKSSYQSKYIDFVSAEIEDNSQPTPKGLQALTADQTKIVNTYDAPPYTTSSSAGSFPFISVGNQYVSAGSYYPPTVIMGQSHSAISSAINDPTTDISRAILGSANYLTAEICALTNNQPANVCTADPIPTIQGKLPQPTASTSHGDLGLTTIDLPWRIAERKQGA